MSVAASLLNQCRKPKGWFGRLTLWRMNWSHSRLTDWGLSQISVKPDDTILDVGCGGGKTVAKLAALARTGRVYGIDYSDESVATSRRTNRHWIATGRVDVRPASVSQLPFPDRTFDLVTAVETHYFWPDLAGDVREVLRVLKPRGTLIIIAEAYKGAKGGKYDRLFERLTEVTGQAFAHLSLAGHRELLEQASYADVRVVEERDRGWLCAIGRRPS